jgi:hypothetical protein
VPTDTDAKDVGIESSEALEIAILQCYFSLSGIAEISDLTTVLGKIEMS